MKAHRLKTRAWPDVPRLSHKLDADLDSLLISTCLEVSHFFLHENVERLPVHDAFPDFAINELGRVLNRTEAEQRLGALHIIGVYRRQSFGDAYVWEISQ